MPRFTESEIQDYKSGKKPSTDWWKETLKERAGIQQHSLNVNGGSESTKFLYHSVISTRMDCTICLISKRYNVRSNIDTQITKDFSVSVDLPDAMKNSANQLSATGSSLLLSIRSQPSVLMLRTMVEKVP